MAFLTFRCVCVLTLFTLLHQTLCAVHRDIKEDNVEEFLIPEDEIRNLDEEAGANNDMSSTRSRFETVLTVSNGGPWGIWGPAQFCSNGSYAVGYDMKIERKKLLRDNTALNAIKLICETAGGKVTGEVTSTVGHWGSWVGPARCQTHGRRRMYLTSFDLQVEAPKKGIFKDNTAANFVKFKCRDYCGKEMPVELVKPPGHGFWGTWGNWSAECPHFTTICGIQTKVQKPRGFFHDDTALNDVKFFCCY